MSAGAGNDTINAAFGRDRALGGAGRDFINVATAGPAGIGRLRLGQATSPASTATSAGA